MTSSSIRTRNSSCGIVVAVVTAAYTWERSRLNIGKSFSKQTNTYRELVVYVFQGEYAIATRLSLLDPESSSLIIQPGKVTHNLMCFEIGCILDTSRLSIDD